MAEVFQHTNKKREETQTWGWCIACVRPEYVVPGCVMLKVCLAGKDGENRSMQRCYNCDRIGGGKEKVVCPNCCLLSSEITGFLEVCHEYS